MKAAASDDLRAEYVRLFDEAAPDLRGHLVQVIRALCGYVDEPLGVARAADTGSRHGGAVTPFRTARRRSPR